MLVMEVDSSVQTYYLVYIEFSEVTASPEVCISGLLCSDYIPSKVQVEIKLDSWGILWYSSNTNEG